ncbi:hypothetical protein HOLleu_17328 [Holothuria leucospilota]|uniref:Uncharacterized protein n=1 Tax=Holothuria leucospilota TaxID=206669 RepID=A0A9Q1HBP0_HOLLE|nr:hypothetical protein HOLleu_17328 [Holothuria leucospilota]
MPDDFLPVQTAVTVYSPLMLRWRDLWPHSELMQKRKMKYQFGCCWRRRRRMLKLKMKFSPSG